MSETLASPQESSNPVIQLPTSAALPPDPNGCDHAASAPQSNNPIIQESISASADGSRHRNGKVARLPKAVRDRINHLLDDGLTYVNIIHELDPDRAGLTPAHIGSWKAGGYQDYLREQRRLELCRPSHEFLATFAGQSQGVETYQAAPKLAAALLCEIFVDFGPDTIRRALQENPMNAFRLLNALARILSGGQRFERFLAEKAAYEAASRPPAPDQCQSPTEAELRQVLRDCHIT